MFLAWGSKGGMARHLFHRHVVQLSGKRSYLSLFEISNTTCFRTSELKLQVLVFVCALLQHYAVRAFAYVFSSVISRCLQYQPCTWCIQCVSIFTSSFNSHLGFHLGVRAEGKG